jgi:hypothetical protein
MVLEADAVRRGDVDQLQVEPSTGVEGPQAVGDPFERTAR